MTEQRIDSPLKDLHSSATNGSQDEEFEDAVDELPVDEFKPARPESELPNILSSTHNT